MEELEKILLEHAEKYSQMQPTDAVKLIYQNEYGGGHLIRDEEAAMEYLRREYESVTKDPAAPLYEDIGNGIVRVNLAAVEETDLKQLGQDFIRSAAAHKGSLDGFQKKLAVLIGLTERGAFSFGIEALQAYLAEYERAGFPAVSHSPEYRQTYKPAYRIILRRKE